MPRSRPASVASCVARRSAPTPPGRGRTVDESWPTGGVPTSAYSADKAAAERIVDNAEDRLLVARMRPVLIFQDDAASKIGRYFIGPLVPQALIRRGALRFTPLPADLGFQVVHVDDVALRLVDRQAAGAFNVAAAVPFPRTDRITDLRWMPRHDARDVLAGSSPRCGAAQAAAAAASPRVERWPG